MKPKQQQKRKRLYTSFPKSIYILGCINLINGAGSFVFPFLSLFLTQKLGYTAGEAGMFTMFSIAIYVPGSILTSHIADKFSRKKIVIITQFFCSFLFIVCGFFVNINPHIVPYIILASLLFDGATDPARSALYTDHTTPENRQEAFSFFYLCFNIGFAFGPALAGFLFVAHADWLFFGNGIVAIIALVVLAFNVHDKSPSKEMIEESMKKDEDDSAVKGSVFKALLSRPLLCIYVIINSFFSLCISVAHFGLPLFMTSLFGLGGSEKFGILMSLNAAVVLVCTVIIVHFSKKHRPLSMIVLSSFLYCISFFFMAQVSAFKILLVLTVVFSVGEIFWATNSDYFVMNHTPLGHRARFSALLAIIQGSGYAIGPMIGGFILNSYDFKDLFFISSFILFACCVLFFVVRYAYIVRDSKKNTSRVDVSQ